MADNDGGGSNAAVASGVFNIALTTQTGDEVAVGELIYRNQSSDRGGDRLPSDARRRYGASLTKVS